MTAPATQAPSGRAFVSCCAGLIGYAIFYALPIYARLPRPFYDPLARHWLIAASAGPIPMGYLGQIVWASVGALVFAAVASRLARRAPSARAFTLGAAWTLTTLAIVLGYFTWNNWP
jgi:hypothetical protein